jgi:hypothetical protein
MAPGGGAVFVPRAEVQTVNDQVAIPFDSVESAQEYLKLLSETLSEAKRDVEGDLASQAGSKVTRRLEALRLVLYKLEKLEQHVKASSRLLNDLRTLRRLLLQERAEASESKSS